MQRANNYVDDTPAEQIGGSIKPKGSVIFPKVGGAIFTDKKRILGADAFVDNNLMAVWSKDRDRCLSEFLYLYFLRVSLADLSNPGPLPSINAGKVYEQSIALPTTSEQRAIAAILGEARRAVDIQTAICGAALDAKRSLEREVFTRGLRGNRQKESEIGPVPETWECVPFASVRERLQYGTSERCTEGGGSHPVLRIPNIDDGRINTKDLKYCDLSDRTASTWASRASCCRRVRARVSRHTWLMKWAC